MANVIQKQFHLEETDRLYGDGEPTLVTIRQATMEENKLRAEFLSKLKKEYVEEYAEFIRFGYKSYKQMWYRDYLRHDDYVDDTHNRLWLVRERMKHEIIRYEIELALASCNILNSDGKTPAMNFVNGHIHGGLPNLYEEVEDELHKKVLEMNPSWSGEINRIMTHFIKESGVSVVKQEPGNFTDLALKSTFVKSKSQLISLMKEINRDVFDNEGSVKLNVPSIVLIGNTRGHEFIIRKMDPPLGNVILFPVLVSASKVEREKYIGILEHGSYEIRIVAKNRGFNYWDTNIEEIIPTLRVAIEWWKRKPAKVRREDLNSFVESEEDDSWMEEAKAVYDDFMEDGFLDEE